MEQALRRLTGTMGFIATVGATASWGAGVVTNPVYRLLSWIICVVLLGIATFLPDRRSSLTDPATNQPYSRPYRPNMVWLGLLAMVLFLLIADWGIHFAGWMVPARAEVLHDYDDLNSMKEVVESAVSLIEKSEKIKIDCSTSFHGPAPLLDALSSLNEFANPVLLGSLTESDARSFYDGQIYPHFLFDLVKNNSADEVVVEDVIVRVHAFTPLPQFVEEGAAMGQDDIINNHLLLYELAPRDCESLPWDFSPKWHLPDSSTYRVSAWGQQSTARLRHQFAMRFIAKLFSTVPGIYEYDVDVVVRVPLSPSHSLPLFSERKLVAFTDVQVVDRIEDDLLKKYGYERNTESNYNWDQFVPIPIQ